MEVLKSIRQKMADVWSIPLLVLESMIIACLQFLMHSDFAAHVYVVYISEIIIKCSPRTFINSMIHRSPPPAFLDSAHQWQDPVGSVSRSPCPALNTLANHHFLPHDGRNIHPQQFVHALEQGFNLTKPLAYFLTYGGFFLLRQWGPIALEDLARHDAIEHNASLAHRNCRPDNAYAPTKPSPDVLRRVLSDFRHKDGLNVQDIAKARVKRENECDAPLDAMHAEIARGEMALVVDIFGKASESDPKELEVDRELLKNWWEKEKFPDGWEPKRRQGLLETIRTASEIRGAMGKLRPKEDQKSVRMEG